MCGRYALYGPVSRLRERFSANIDELAADFGPRYNAAPMQLLPVVRQRPSGERVVHLLRWGLIPGWAKDETIATRLINARGETLAAGVRHFTPIFAPFPKVPPAPARV